ncbi:MAG: cytochrome c biogenesis protein CcsA [Pirellulales bacterium]|nr:cytochrome c biogenesis protein CcsA [Pirellulales bacterium]
MLTGISILCFAASYGVAFTLEVVRLRRKAAWARLPLIIATAAGLLAHTLFLYNNSTAANALPISTADWLLWAALVLAIVYFAAIFYLPRTPTGLALIPIVLGLILSSKLASTSPLATEESFYLWGMLHGTALLLGTTAVSIGFLAGLMYLLQDYALKHARSPANRLRLPSLEWLERVNSRALGISTALIAFGFASGLAMALTSHRGDLKYALWTDPVVISLAAMLVWLIVAEIFRLSYPAARGGKVAYLTLASFIFLIMTLVSFALFTNLHALAGPTASKSRTLDGESRIVDYGSHSNSDPKSAVRNPQSLS